MKSRHHAPIALCSALALMLGMAGTSSAQTTPDSPGLTLVSAGHGKVRFTVTAGPNGAPAGFAVWWATAAQYYAGGYAWPVPGQGYAAFTGTGTLNTWGASQVAFALAPNQSLDIEVGDLSDETGVAGTVSAELQDGQEYYFCAYAIGQGGGSNSPLSVTLDQATTVQGSNCTFTQGFWKTHTGPTDWPVAGLTLGTVSYTKTQLISIYGQAPAGNGLVSLAHQLIATKLNIANGADGSSIASTIAAADALIGSQVVPPVGGGSLSPGSTSSLTQALDDYNSGTTGPGHCPVTPAQSSTWGRIKSLYR